MTISTAILVNGTFYRKRAQKMLGSAKAEDRANELENYCMKHLSNSSQLHQIFYYDCLPEDKIIYHVYTKKNINYGESNFCSWMNTFINSLKAKRKFSLRLGKLVPRYENEYHTLKTNVLKELFDGTKQFNELTEDDFMLSVEQKGLEMQIAIDIASLAYKKEVNRIVFISGDKDFLPAAKLARREGLDFILDPLFNHISSDIIEHIDGLETCDERFSPSK